MGISNQRLILLGLLPEEACSKLVNPIFIQTKDISYDFHDHSRFMHICKKPIHTHTSKEIVYSLENNKKIKKIQQKYQYS